MKKYSTYLFLFSILIVILSCESMEENFEPETNRAELQGSFYNQCLVPPYFYINLDSMAASCVSSLPLDSFDSPGWTFGCLAEDLTRIDTSEAHIRFKPGFYEVEARDPSIEITDTEFIINGEEIMSNLYPNSIAKRIETEQGIFLMVVINRYIAGCSWNEYLWEYYREE